MPTPTFTEPPTAPSRSDAPATFITRANAFVAWFGTFWAELVTGVSWIASTATTIASDAAQAAAARLGAAGSQAVAAAAADTASTGAASAAEATAALASFRVIYLGDYTSDPTAAVGGGPIGVGSFYWNTVANEFRVWTGAAFVTPTAGAGYLSNAGGTVSGTLQLAAALQLTGDIAPSQITANQNDYNPTGLAGASTLRLSSDAIRNITGLQGGADGRIICPLNIGSFDIILKDADTGSTAGNRFDLGGDVRLAPKQGCILRYDATLSRWTILGTSRGPSSVAIVQDQKANNTAGQSLTASGWRTRDLNTEVTDSDALVTVASNQITINVPGTYVIEATGSVGAVGSGQLVARSRLYDVSGAAVIAQGNNVRADNSSTDSTINDAVTTVVGVLTVATTKTIEFQTYPSVGAITGAALNASAVEVYSTVTIRKKT